MRVKTFPLSSSVWHSLVVFGPTLFHLVRDNVAAVKKVAILRFVSDSFDDVLCRLSSQRATFSLQFSELARWR